jgi:hypothetical protein
MSNVTTVAPNERKLHIAADVLSLAAYEAFKIKFNSDLPKNNARIEYANKGLGEGQKPTPLLVSMPTETVPMISIRDFIVTLDGYRRVHIPKGIFYCPIELVDHWYLDANGVKKFENPDEPRNKKVVEEIAATVDNHKLETLPKFGKGKK